MSALKQGGGLSLVLSISRSQVSISSWFSGITTQGVYYIPACTRWKQEAALMAWLKVLSAPGCCFLLTQYSSSRLNPGGWVGGALFLWPGCQVRPHCQCTRFTAASHLGRKCQEPELQLGSCQKLQWAFSQTLLGVTAAR